jgi:Tfp pilus assembly protein PilF
LLNANRELSDMIFGGRSFSGRERNCVFLNIGNRDSTRPQFACASAVSGLDLDDDARAIALVDWDFDGDQDAWLSNRNAPRLRFMRNDAPRNNHFLALRLQGNGSTSNRDAIGARIEVYGDDAEKVPRISTLRAGEGFLAQSSKWIHFGLGSVSTIAKVVVRWPGGDAEAFDGVKVDSHYLLVQGTGVANIWTPPSRPTEFQPSQPKIDRVSDAARIPLAYRLPMVSVPYDNSNGSREILRFNSGRPLLVNLWASWCQPCLGEIDELVRRADQIKAAGIDVLLLSVDGLADGTTSEAADELVGRMQIPFRTGHATTNLLHTFQSLHDRQIAMRLPLPLPTSFLVDRHGQLAVIYKGPLDVDDLLSDATQELTTSRQRFASAAPFPGRTIDDPRIDDIRRRVETLIRFRLAMDVEQVGQLAEARQHYRGVFQLEPNYAEAHNNYGNVLARLGRFAEAEVHLRRAIELVPDFDLAHHNLGNVLLQQQEISEAIQHYEQSIRLAPDHAGYPYSLGNALMSQGDFGSAVTWFRKAIELDDSFADAHNNLGFALERLGKLAEATRCYRRALELHPQHQPAAANLARIQAR